MQCTLCLYAEGTHVSSVERISMTRNSVTPALNVVIAHSSISPHLTEQDCVDK